MKQIKRITLRLCLEKPTDNEIADYLNHLDRKKYHTVNSAIKTILYEHIHGTVSETNKNNDIVSVIKSTLETEIPKLFATKLATTLVSGIHIKKEKADKFVIETNSDDDIDMDFIGG